MSPLERLENLEMILEDLRERNDQVPILVEGDRDEISLRTLGFDGEIVKINRGVTIFVLCETYARTHREAIILTDWDHMGGKLARILIDALEANSVRPDPSFRRAIARATKKEIVTVEGLAGYMASLRRSVARRYR